MFEKDNCSGCPQHHDCKSMYQALGKAEGSYVAIRSISAFLVPILIFVLGLAVFGKLFESSINGSNARTMVSVFCSLLLCSVYVGAFKLFSARGVDKNTCLIKHEGDEKSK